jgi:hypothetical protein
MMVNSCLFSFFSLRFGLVSVKVVTPLVREQVGTAS